MSALISIVIAHALFAQLAFSQQKRDTPECPGVYYANGSASGCCVGGTLPPVILSTCPGWPACTGPATTTTTQTPISCVTIISASDSDYTSKISAASSSMEASGTHYQSGLTIDNAVTDGPTTGSAPSTAPSATGSSVTGSAASASGSSSSGSGGATSASSDVNLNAFVPVMAALGAAFLAIAALL